MLTVVTSFMDGAIKTKTKADYFLQGPSSKFEEEAHPGCVAERDGCVRPAGSHSRVMWPEDEEEAQEVLQVPRG